MNQSRLGRKSRLLFITITALAASIASVTGAPQARLQFEVADLRVSPPDGEGRGVLQMERAGVTAGRYEIQKATMLDLVRIAYSIDPTAVFGGPNWLDLDRFDLVAKLPMKAQPPTINLMLQSLLADRFQLVTHKDTKPLPAWVLSQGADKPKLKPADDPGESSCRLVEDNQRLSCRNITMDSFVAWLRDGKLTTLPVINRTAIEGAWDFHVRYSAKGGMDGVMEGSPLPEAIDKQLGLKLELKTIPQPVLVVDSVNRTPTPNPPNVEKLLPPAPVQFEVASIRPCQAVDLFGERRSPGGYMTTGCMPLDWFITTAWNLCVEAQAGPNITVALCGDDFEGAPKWLKSRYFNIVAKAPAEIEKPSRNENYRAMLRNLLIDRFKMASHYENRLLNAFTLVAAKPKLKKADPAGRSGCRSNGLGIGVPTVITCRNVTMAQFAERLNHEVMIRVTGRRVVDASGIAGAWDFTLSYRQRPDVNPANAAAGIASDPTGGVNVTIFEAIEQQLGLKLVEAKRNLPIFVIDHIEEKPTDN